MIADISRAFKPVADHGHGHGAGACHAEPLKKAAWKLMSNDWAAALTSDPALNTANPKRIARCRPMLSDNGP